MLEIELLSGEKILAELKPEPAYVKFISTVITILLLLSLMVVFIVSSSLQSEISISDLVIKLGLIVLAVLVTYFSSLLIFPWEKGKDFITNRKVVLRRKEFSDLVAVVSYVWINITIPLESVQDIRITQNFLQKPFGLYSVKFKATYEQVRLEESRFGFIGFTPNKYETRKEKENEFLMTTNPEKITSILRKLTKQV